MNFNGSITIPRDGNGSITIPRDGNGSIKIHYLPPKEGGNGFAFDLNNNVNANKIVGKYWVLPPSSLGPPSGLRFAPSLGGSSGVGG